MYTIEDIRQIAIQIEQNGEKTYRSAALNADSPELEKILNWMADEEHRHGKWFKAMPAKVTENPSEYPEVEALGRSLLKEMVEDRTFSLEEDRLESAEGVLDVLIQSLDFEKDTILFYDMIKSLMEDHDGIAQLELIIDEERGHVRVLERLMDKFKNGSDIDYSCIKDL